MKKGLSIFSAILAGLASCVKIETFEEDKEYDSVLEYAVNSKNEVNHMLLGPVDICPITWVDMDAECYVQVDNERVLILNRTEPLSSGKQKVKMLALHYNSKEDIVKDFEQILNFVDTSFSGNVTLHAVSGEASGSGFEKRTNIILENVSVDFTDDSFGKEFYFIMFNYLNEDGNTESSYIIIPAEFVA